MSTKHTNKQLIKDIASDEELSEATIWQRRGGGRLPLEAKFLALGAASVLATAVGNSHAAIQYSDPTDFNLLWYSFDLDGDSSDDFRGESIASFLLSIGASNGAGVYGSSGAFSFSSGAQIGGGSPGSSYLSTFLYLDSYVNAGDVFLGGITSSGKYAWLRVNVTASTILVKDYAYEDSGGCILAGATSGGPASCGAPTNILPAIINQGDDGDTLSVTGNTIHFEWDAGSGGANPTEYWLWIGSSQGASDLANTGTLGTDTDVDITGLPLDGSTIWLRLWWQEGGVWQYTDQFFTSPSVALVSVNPADGASLSGSSVDFTLTSSDATSLWIWVGTDVSHSDIFNSAEITDWSSPITVTGLPADGSTVYVRLWAFVDGKWVSYDYTYTSV